MLSKCIVSDSQSIWVSMLAADNAVIQVEKLIVFLNSVPQNGKAVAIKVIARTGIDGSLRLR